MQVVLLSDKCTTGWANLGHGELWLTPNCLVRVGLAALTAKAALSGFGAVGVLAGNALVKRKVDGRPLEIDAAEWNSYLAGHDDKTVSIPLRAIVNARFRSGLSTSRLQIALADRSHHKLLWTRNRIAGSLLRDALNDRLT